MERSGERFQTIGGCSAHIASSTSLLGGTKHFEGAFRAAKKAGANALLTVTNIRISAYLKRIAELANNNRLPSMFERSEYVEAGGLMSYGASDALFRRAAISLHRMKLQTEFPSRDLTVLPLRRGAGSLRVPQHGNAGELGNDLLEQLQSPK